MTMTGFSGSGPGLPDGVELPRLTPREITNSDTPVYDGLVRALAAAVPPMPERCGATYGSGCRGSGTNGMHVCGKEPGHGDPHGDCILQDG